MRSDIGLGRAGRTAGGLVLAGLLLVSGGCGEETGGAGQGPQPLPEDTYRHVVDQGADPALVYVIDPPGFELAVQSAGVVGGSDYGASYVPTNPPPTPQVYLEVRGGSYDATRCERDPLRGPSGDYSTGVESCEPDDGGWYRSGGDWHEYVVGHRGHHLTVGGPSAVDRDVLAEAALGARRQDGSATSSSTPDAPVDPPSTRGDLPTTGDGAPVDPQGSSSPGG